MYEVATVNLNATLSGFRRLFWSTQHLFFFFVMVRKMFCVKCFFQTIFIQGNRMLACGSGTVKYDALSTARLSHITQPELA